MFVHDLLYGVLAEMSAQRSDLGVKVVTFFCVCVGQFVGHRAAGEGQGQHGQCQGQVG